VSSFLFKTEPTEYSFSDLVRDKRAVWDGISNALALIHLRSVEKGDSVVIYHSGSGKEAVGLAIAVSGPYTDPAIEDPKRVVVDLKPLRAFKKPVPLTTFKTDPVLRTVDLVRISRLSVMPLSAAQLKRVLQHAETELP
jgi:predicted RNA-binding protein with PUA-like domain